MSKTGLISEEVSKVKSIIVRLRFDKNFINVFQQEMLQVLKKNAK